MRLAGSALGVALVVFGPSCARADLVTYTASGLIGRRQFASSGTVYSRTTFILHLHLEHCDTGLRS